MQTEAPHQEPAPEPLMLEGYDFVEFLGSTPLANVWLYLEQATQTHVVVKEIPLWIAMGSGFSERLEERFFSMSAVSHPNLLRMTGMGRTEEGGCYLIREFVDGRSLQDWLKETKVDHASAINIIITLANALETIHACGRVYGALCASSVWISKDGDVWLVPFLLSSLLEPTQLVQLFGLGVIHHMPPEFTSCGVLTVQSDVYSLAALYYELLTGERPQGAIGKNSLPARIDFRERQALFKALSTNPEQRQSSMADFVAPLVAVANRSATMPKPTEDKVARIQSTQNRPTWVIASIAFLVLLSIGIAVFLWQRGRKSSELPTATNVHSEQTAKATTGSQEKKDTPSVESPVAEVSPETQESESDLASSPQQTTNENSVLVPEPDQGTPASTFATAVGRERPLGVYLYAAYFYLGDDVSLLKLEFGNAGHSYLNCNGLMFQCALSIDDRMDELLPAAEGSLPGVGRDLAAGGFTAEWLGLDHQYLMPGKKLWTKHTFRIDTSNDEVLKAAKFLLVSVSQSGFQTSAVTNGSVIAIPLDHPNQWHTVTQEPTDAAAAESKLPSSQAPSP
jgi:serine/threonine protein kinase